jgi:hypothetical protein
MMTFPIYGELKMFQTTNQQMNVLLRSLGALPYVCQSIPLCLQLQPTRIWTGVKLF